MTDTIKQADAGLSVDSPRTDNGQRPAAPRSAAPVVRGQSTDSRLTDNGRARGQSAGDDPRTVRGSRWWRRPRTDRQAADSRPRTDSRPADNRPRTAPARGQSASGGAPQTIRGLVGLPRGYGQAFLVLVATTLIASVFSFLFSFGNVRSVAITLGLPGWIQPLISPAVDVTVVGLIIVIQYLVTAGVDPRRLRAANALLGAAGFAMMAANVAPSLIVGVVTGDAKAYGRAALEAVTPALLIAWAHVGPKLVRLFVEIRQEVADRAHQVAMSRTIATEHDRAAAAAALADAVREAAAIRAQAAADTEAARTKVGEELAAAAAIRQREQEAADDAVRERARAERELADSLDTRGRSADAVAAQREHAAKLLADRAEAELAEARRLVAAAAADKADAERDRDLAAADRRTADELLAAAESASRPRTTPRTAPRTSPVDESPAGVPGETGARKTGEELLAERVAEAKRLWPQWATSLPKQGEIALAFNLKSAGQASAVRKQLAQQAADVA